MQKSPLRYGQIWTAGSTASGGKLLADHARSWAKHLTVTDPQHVAAAALLRQAFQARASRQEQEENLIRDLSEYDRAFGLHHIEGLGA